MAVKIVLFFCFIYSVFLLFLSGHKLVLKLFLYFKLASQVAKVPNGDLDS